jgi:cytochrome P450
VSRAAWTICRDPELYPNPDAFVPERYLKIVEMQLIVAGLTYLAMRKPSYGIKQ